MECVVVHVESAKVHAAGSITVHGEAAAVYQEAGSFIGEKVYFDESLF